MAVRIDGWRDEVSKLSAILPESVTDQLTSALDFVYAPIIARVVARLQSIWVKVGQSIAGRSDMWPPAWVRAFAILHDGMPADPEAVVRATIAAELGPVEEVP